MLRGGAASSTRRGLPSVVVSLAFAVLGVVSLRVLPITRLPALDVPTVSVLVTQPGAGPAELSSQVTKPIEDAVSGVEGIRHIISTVTDGRSVTTVQLQPGRDLNRTFDDIRDAVVGVRSSLPLGSAEPLVQRVDSLPLPIVTYAAVAPAKTPQQLSWFVDDVVRRALQGVRGVGRIERVGGVDREIAVALDPDRLQAVGLTAADVSRRLRGSRVDIAGGRAEVGGRDQSIRTLAVATTLAGLAGTMLPLPGGGQMRLDDLGSVTDTIEEPGSFARLDGKPVVGFSVDGSRSASDVATAAAVARTVDAIKAAHPEVDLELIDDTTAFSRDAIASGVRALWEGAALALLAALLVLRDWRAALVAVAALPLSVLPVFWVLDRLGLSLNLVTLLAITVSTGLALGHSFLAIDAVRRHLHTGEGPAAAVDQGVADMGPSLIAIGLSSVAVFLPISAMDGVAGQSFKEFGITVSVQVFASLLVASFVTPVLAARILRPSPVEQVRRGLFSRAFRGVLGWSVRHRFTTAAVGIGLAVASLSCGRLLPTGFLPVQETGRSRLAVELPSGSPLSATESVTEEIARRLRQRQDIASVFVHGGHDPPSSDEVRMASVIITYVPSGRRSLTQHDIELAISRDLQQLPDIRSWFVERNGLRALELVVTGADSDTVGNVAAEVASQMHRIPIVDNVVSSATLDRPELRIRPRGELAARLGVTTETLSETIRVATVGDVEPALSRLSDGDRQIPIRVQFDASLRADRRMLEQLRVPLGRQETLPLGSVADISLEQGPSNITRYDRERQASVGADLVGDAVIGQALGEVDKLPIMKSLPPHVSVKLSGDVENTDELFEGFGGLMRQGLALLYAVLAVVIGSLLQPLTILFVLPFSLAGAMLGLLATDRPFGLPAAIGILTLMGIVTKDAILLVKGSISAVRAGETRDRAVRDAGMQRAGAVSSTTLVMVAGLLPSALSIGADAEFRSPIALAIICGLVASTLASLVFVPALFLLVDDAGHVVSRLASRLLLVAPSRDPRPTGPRAAEQASAPDALTRSAGSRPVPAPAPPRS